MCDLVLSDALLAYMFETEAMQARLGLLQFVCRRWRDIAGENYTIDKSVGVESPRLVAWGQKNGNKWGIYGAVCAAHDNRIRVLLHPKLAIERITKSPLICAAAAASGHLELLQELRLGPKYAWNELTCCMAARGGHLNVLQWARINGCLWSGSTCFNASHYGHLDVLQWAIGTGCPYDPVSCVKGAVQNGHLNVVDWIIGMRRRYYTVLVREECVFNGLLDMLIWTYNNDFQWCMCISVDARRAADVAAYADLCETAIENGHLNIIKWYHTIGYRPIDVCMVAASYNQLEILKWARETGAEWGDGFTKLASVNGYVAILKYAIDNGCVYDLHDCLAHARAQHNNELVVYLKNI